jgi:hypothetical protein
MINYINNLYQQEVEDNKQLKEWVDKLVEYILSNYYDKKFTDKEKWVEMKRDLVKKVCIEDNHNDVQKFQKLGYKKKELDFVFSRFWEEWENEELAKTFSFNKEYKTVSITDENDFGLSMEEIEAISDYCKELGWL